MFLKFFIFTIISVVSIAATHFGSKNEIINLPGLNFDINFKHYSGYLRVSKIKFLHYWFVESQNDPSTDPLIFWFNGGPGCSSLEGILNEMGPYVLKHDGKTLRKNPNTWNKFASVVYIESPAGVGYSYDSNGNESASDTLTANYNYKALKQFFAVHTMFRNHRTFIIGESYAGVYIPILAAKIIDGQSDFPINFEGIGIGNGLVNFNISFDTQMQFAYNHGLVDEKAWNHFVKQCCNKCIDNCEIQSLTGDCKHLYSQIFISLYSSGINIFDIYQTCDSSSLLNSPRMKLYFPEFLTKELENKIKQQKFHKNDKGDPCIKGKGIETYMNLHEVRKALHINENLGEWELCDGMMLTHYKMQYKDTTLFFKKIVAAKVRVLLYYGDTDMMCNFLGGQKFTDQLGYQLLKSKYPFEVNGQVGGFVTVYDENVTFVTIRGAGHMAPEWRAPETSFVIEKFIKNQNIQ